MAVYTFAKQTHCFEIDIVLGMQRHLLAEDTGLNETIDI